MEEMDHGKGIQGLIARGLDVPNFLKDISRIPNYVLRWGTTSNPFLRVPKGIYEP